MTTSSARIAKLSPRHKPNPQHLIHEIRAAVQQAQGLGLYDKLAQCHDVMHCKWAEQSATGMKMHKNAKPWRGTIDSRVRESKMVVDDTVRLMMRAVRSGNVSIGPESQGDEQLANAWDAVWRFYRARSKRMINHALKLFFTCVAQFGYGILQVDWRDRQKMLPHKLTSESLRAHLYAVNKALYIQELPPESGGQLSPQEEAALTEQVAVEVEEMLMQGADSARLVSLLQEMDPKMPPTEAKIAAKELSKTGQATYYAPKSKGGMPRIHARIPMVNCIHGMDLDPEIKTWMAIPERLDEAALRERAAINGWKVDLEEMKKYPNQGMAELDSISGHIGVDWLLNGVGVGMKLDKSEEVPWFEVVTVYRVAVTEAGIPAVYETEVFPAMPNLLLSHECLPIVRQDDEPAMPFVVMNRESTLLSVQSAGIPQEMLTDQLAMKKILDGTVAAAELAAFPPSLRSREDKEDVMPGSTVTLRQTGGPGAQSRFLDVPGVDMGALKALEILKATVAERYHRGEADPNLRAAYEEDIGNEAVLAYAEMVGLIWAYIQAYVTDLTATRIAGRNVNLNITEADLMGTADVHVDFSPVSLNQERAKEKIDFVKTLLQFGSSSVDTDAAVRDVARTWDANLAEVIIVPAETGAGMAAADERQAISEMQSGFEVVGRNNAPQVRLAEYSNWLRNPESVQMLVLRPVFYELVISRVKGLEMQHQQATANVITGQTGQKRPSWEDQGRLSERIVAMVDQARQQMQMQPAA